MSLWAFAKLGFHPGRMLVDFGARIEEIKHEFVPQACSNTLWALAVLQVCTACRRCNQDTYSAHVLLSSLIRLSSWPWTYPWLTHAPLPSPARS